jgi:chromosome segregation ATPase
MENDYKSQQSTHDSTISEMDRRMVELRSSVDRLQQMKQKLDEEKNSLIKNNEQLQLQVNICFHKNMQFHGKSSNTILIILFITTEMCKIETKKPWFHASLIARYIKSKNCKKY